MNNLAFYLAQIYYNLTGQTVNSIPTGFTDSFWAERIYRYAAGFPDKMAGGKNASFWLESWYFLRTGQNRLATGTLPAWFWLAKLYDQVLRGSAHDPNAQVGYNSAEFWASRLATLAFAPPIPVFNPASLTAPIGAIDFHEDGSALFQDTGGLTPATANNDPIGRANQISGFSATPALQGVIATKPTLKTGVNGINGHNAASYDGADTLDWTGLSAASGAKTIYLVVKPASAVSTLRYYLDIETGRLVIAEFTDSLGKVGWYDGSFHSIANATANIQVLCYALSGVSHLYRDNVSLGTAAYVNQAIGGTVRIGSDIQIVGDTSSFYIGLYGAVYLYGALHTADERNAMHGFLNERWAA